jgi:branched-chain amino acid transport system permease protein
MTGFAAFVNLAINGAVEGLVIALMALSLTLVWGIARFANAAAGDYATLGAYAGVGAQYASAGPVWLGGLGGMAAGSAVALAFYAWVFRALRGSSAVARLVASIGVAFLLRSTITFFLGSDQRTFTMPVARALDFGGIRILPTDIDIALVACGGLAAVFVLLHLTPIGRQMRAVADDPDLARASGIRAGRIMIVLWLVAGALAALSGVLIGVKSVVAPEMGWELLIPAFAAAILGGIGNPVGAVLGGVLLGVFQELSTPFVGFSYKIAVSFLALLVVLLLRPRGLMGRAQLVR